MGKRPPRWLPGERVNETILLQRKSIEQLRADRVLRRKAKKKEGTKEQQVFQRAKAKRKRRLATKKFVPAAAILKEAVRERKMRHGFHKRDEKFQSRLRTVIRKARAAEAPAAAETSANGAGADAEVAAAPPPGPRRGNKVVLHKYLNAPIALAVRVIGKTKSTPKEIELALTRLGLTKLYAGRLIHLSPATDRLTKQLKKQLIVGFPSRDQIDRLIRTRGALWSEEGHQKVALTGNVAIEHAFGEAFNILCVEDLVDALSSVGAPSPDEDSANNGVEEKIRRGKVIDEILKRIAPFDFHPPRALHIEKLRSSHARRTVANVKAFHGFLSGELTRTAAQRAKAKRAKKQSKGASGGKRTPVSAKPS